MSRSTVLITGCSDGGLGAALALQFHAAGYRVFATARNPSKLKDSKAAGIETLSLDVLSGDSAKKCVAEVQQLTGGTLDMLVNNAGMTYYGALSEVSISDCKKMYDLNVWANVAMIQAFLPLLLKSKVGGTIVNHTSIAGTTVTLPFIGPYASSKAAMAALTQALRGELAPFGIKVVDLKTGSVRSNISANNPHPGLSEKSLYYSAREWLNYFLSGAEFDKNAIPAEKWAKGVVASLSQRDPPKNIWNGAYAGLVWFATCLPVNMAQGIAWNNSRISEVDKKIKEYGTEKAIADAYGK